MVQAFLPEKATCSQGFPFPIGMRVAYQQELSALVSDDPDDVFMDRWLEAVGWLFFYEPFEKKEDGSGPKSAE